MLFTDQPKYINAGDMSADITGAPVSILNHAMYSFHCIWTGTPTGNLKIQASSDPRVDIDKRTGTSTATWEDVDTVAAGGAAGSKLWDNLRSSVKWVRIFYDQTASNGTLNVALVAKAGS